MNNEQTELCGVMYILHNQFCHNILIFDNNTWKYNVMVVCQFVFFRKRQYDLDGEVFEMLSTFTDFIAFKEMCLDYRAVS